MERGVITQEIRGGDDEPGDYMWDALKGLAYAGTPLAWPVCGTMDSVEKISEADLLRHQKEHCIGPKVLVVMAGKIPDELICWPPHQLQALVGDGGARQSVVLEPQTSPKFVFLKKDRTQANLVMAFKMPKGLSQSDRAALRLMEAVLSDGMGSRLFQVLREKYGLVYDADAVMALFPGHGLFEIRADMEPANIVSAVEVVLSELHRLAHEAVPEQELRRAREYYWGETSRRLVNPGTVAEYFAGRALLGLPLQDPYEARQLQRDVTPGQIKEVASRLFRRENLNLVLASSEISDHLKSHIEIQF